MVYFDSMMLDIETICAIALAIAMGAIVYFAYQKYSTEKIDQVYQVITSLYSKYKDKIKQDNPQLADECDNAIKVLDEVMSDGNITALEALEVAKVFIPLTNRLVKFIKDKYIN